jgi:hypothetical protein
MKSRLHLFSLCRNLDSLIAAICGFILIQVFSKHSGIGISPDSVTYLSAARHIVHGPGFRSFDLLPVVEFPAGYPFFLSGISFITRLDPLQFAPWLNGVLFGILLYTCGSIMNGFYKSNNWYKRILLLCFLLSPALQEVYSMLWSETIFLLLVLFFMICMSDYLRLKTTRSLTISCLICALACLDRYAGIFLVPVGLILIFFNENISFRKRITHCIMFGSFSLSLFLVNIVRNYQLTGLLTGRRQKGNLGFLSIIQYFGGVFCDWFQLDRNAGTAIGITLALIVIFLLVIFFSYRRRKPDHSFEYIIALTGVMYCVFMLLSSFLTRYEQFTNRLLAPVFIPLLWSLSWWIPGFIERRTVRIKWVAGLFFLLVAARFINVQLAADYEFYDGVKDAGIPDYGEDEFALSGIAQFLGKNKTIFDSRFPIYSNAGDAVYFVTGLPATQLPSVVFPKKVRQYYDAKNNYLVWFRNLDNPEMPKLDSILKNKNMVLLKQLPEGAVYFSN